MIDGTVIGTYLLTGHAERVFIGQQDEGQIIVPQIFVEAILGGKIEERFHLLIDPAGQIFFFCEIKFIVEEDAGTAFKRMLSSPRSRYKMSFAFLCTFSFSLMYD